MTHSLAIVFIAVGVFFMFVASLGILRLPDLYSRLHAPTKAATLGLACLLLALALVLPFGAVITKAVLALLFIAATAPVGAHILARAAYRSGVEPAATTELDQYREYALQRRAAAQTRKEAGSTEPGASSPLLGPNAHSGEEGSPE